MWLPIIGLLLGIALGFAFLLPIPDRYSLYLAVLILVALDSVAGAIRAELQGEYDNKIFLSGFVVSAFLAMGLTVLGRRLGVNLYYGAVAALGIRLFNNLAVIRRQFIR